MAQNNQTTDTRDSLPKSSDAADGDAGTFRTDLGGLSGPLQVATAIATVWPSECFSCMSADLWSQDRAGGCDRCGAAWTLTVSGETTHVKQWKAGAFSPWTSLTEKHAAEGLRLARLAASMSPQPAAIVRDALETIKLALETIGNIERQGPAPLDAVERFATRLRADNTKASAKRMAAGVARAQRHKPKSKQSQTSDARKSNARKKKGSRTPKPARGRSTSSKPKRKKK